MLLIHVIQRAKTNLLLADMAKGTLGREWLPEPNVWDQGSFVPASSQNPPPGVIVLHEAYLDFPSTSSSGMPGIFSCSPEYRSLERPPFNLHQQESYDLAVEDVPLSANKIVRYVVSPASDTTIILMDLRRNVYSKNYFTNSSTDVQEAVYFLQSKEGGSSLSSGLRTNVKLDLVVWDFERFTLEGGIYGGAARRFQIDGAVLLDPKRPGQFRPSESPVCLLGMDFLMKYPYLLFEPEYDTRGEIDFTLARGSLVYRPYSTCTEVMGKLVVHISARHDTETGNIGCGVFFKSKSILNLFSGVSKYDKNGNKHTEQLWERGILMGVIKALHVVEAFPANREFTDVIIRTGSPPTNSLLSQIQHTADDLYKHLGNGHDGYSLDDKFSCPSPNSDLVMYIYHRFIRKQSGIKVHFHGFSTNENYDAVEAAGILASAGAEMEEFYIENEFKPVGAQNFSGYSINRFRGHKCTKPHDITLLNHHGGFLGHSIYASLGLDGYFHIPKEKAHKAMEAADKKARLTLSREDAACTLGYAPWEGEVAAEPNGFLDIKNYEYHAIPPRSDFKTLDGILGEDTVQKLKTCFKENPKFNPEKVLQIIQGSTREIKIHEFLSMQTKEYREGYLKELEQRGLEKGWHFCKDKAWNGYLRRNLRIHNRDKWMRFDGENAGGAAFTLSSERKDLSQWDQEKSIGKFGQGKDTRHKEEVFQVEVNTGLTEARNDTGKYHRGNREPTEPCDNAQFRKDSEKNKPDAKEYLNSQPSLSKFLDNDRSDDIANDGAIGIRGRSDTEEPTDFERSSYISLSEYSSDKMEHMGIGARVAARHRYGPQRAKGQYTFGNGTPDDNYGIDDSSDSDYRYHIGDSGGHSSEQWSDLEDSTDSNNSSYTTNFKQGKRDYSGNLSSTNVLQQWKSQLNDIIPARVDIVTEGASPRNLAYSLIVAPDKELMGGKEPRECKENSTKTSMPRSSGKHNVFAGGTGKPIPRAKGAEHKWPPFDWMLENFREDYPTATVV